MAAAPDTMQTFNNRFFIMRHGEVKHNMTIFKKPIIVILNVGCWLFSLQAILPL